MNSDPNDLNTASQSGEKDLSKRDTKFFSDVLKLVTGSGFVQVFRILISPVLSRLFLPEYFGVWQNYLSIAKPMGLISSLRYDRAILLPKDRKESANMLVLSLGISLLFSAGTYLPVWLFGDQVAAALNSPDLAKYLWFIPLSIAALGIFEALRQWNSRARKYMRLSLAQVASEVFGEGLMAGFGLAGFTSVAVMIVMQLVGHVSATLAFSYLVFKDDLKFILSNLDWAIIKEGISKYKKFPLFNLWSNLIGNAALYIPSILLSMYFSPTIAGYYAMGNNAIRLPVSVFGNSVGQVFYQRSAKAYHDGGLTSILEGTLKYLILISLFPMLLIAIIGKELFVVAFGASWADAGVYSQILSLWVFFVFITSPISYIPNIMDRNEKFLVFQVLNFVTRIGSLVYGGMKGDVWLALWLFTISGILVYGSMLFWITNIAGMKTRKTLQYLAKGLLSSLPFLVLVLAFKLFNPIPQVGFTSFNLPLDYLGLLVFSILVTLAFYYINLMKDKTIKNEVSRIIGLVKPGKN